MRVEPAARRRTSAGGVCAGATERERETHPRHLPPCHSLQVIVATLGTLLAVAIESFFVRAIFHNHGAATAEALNLGFALFFFAGFIIFNLRVFVPTMRRQRAEIERLGGMSEIFR